MDVRFIPVKINMVMIFNLLETNQFDKLNELIESIDGSNAIESVTFLRTTFPARRLLSNWNNLLERTRTKLSLIYEPIMVDQILRGL